MNSTYPVWVNGVEQLTLSVTDRAIAYGDGVFETLRVMPADFLWQHHFQRLAAGLVSLGIEQDLSKLENQVRDYIRRYQSPLVKLIVTRGSGGRGYKPPEAAFPQVIIQGFNLPAYADEYETGASLYVCKTPLTTNPRLQGTKHLNRLEQVLARAEFSADTYSEGLMCSVDGRVLECTASNLFFSKQGQLMTPDLDQIAVRGTMQRYFLENCEELAGKVLQHSPTLAELFDADEVFICNSVFGIWPVKSIMTQTFLVPARENLSGFTRKLQQEVSKYFA